MTAGNPFRLVKDRCRNHMQVMRPTAFALPAFLCLAAAALPAQADNALDYLPGGSAGSVHLSKPSYDRADQRRSPALRHNEQMRRYWENRAEQRARAERSYDGVQLAPAPQERLPVVIRPTVFSYSAALENVLRIAVGDRVIFRTAERTGHLELLEIGARADGATCRRFRQEVRTPGGPEVSFGSACRMRGGAWRFSE
ncbi:MAG: hypothetical protein TEF_06930 [Rhizobiales bacterium NRL2]|nr:MAG: hypothetical protein TEF_06930 [Rhizobiales bacterium NRL2]